jgi:hypothetical protein
LAQDHHAVAVVKQRERKSFRPVGAGQPGASKRARGGGAQPSLPGRGGQYPCVYNLNITLFRGSIIELTQQQQVISRNLTGIDQFLNIDLTL